MLYHSFINLCGKQCAILQAWDTLVNKSEMMHHRAYILTEKLKKKKQKENIITNCEKFDEGNNWVMSIIWR